MDILERFLSYATVPTSSDDGSDTVPSAQKEFALAGKLALELKEIGVEDAVVTEKCYVYGHIPASAGCENAPKIGFIAHLDTSPDFADAPLHAVVHENYDGSDIVLSDSGRTITKANFPHLGRLVGKTLITTDGHTLLGADDKAGITAIMTAVETIIKDGVPHGSISVAFTPDEECGNSAEYFDIERFGADYAYTVDGGEAGEVVYENFNAASADFDVHGFNIHPGDAKDKMINASLVAMEINSMLPSGDVPSKTEGYEGFFHLTSMSGNVEKSRLEYIVRDHSASVFDARIETLRHIEKVINGKYGAGTAELTVRESYRNMAEKIRPVFEIVERADEAVRRAGLEPVHDPIRGGTDGSHLSFMGLPTPNLGTGGYAFHGPYEHVTVEGMEKAAEIVRNIIELTAGC